MKNTVHFDISSDGKVCEGTLTLCRNYILKSLDEKEEKFYIDNIAEAVQITDIGCGRLELRPTGSAEDGSDNITVCRFSMTCVKEIGELVKVLNHYFESGEFLEINTDDLPVCPKCHRHYARGMNVCMFCVKKSYVFSRAFTYFKPYLKSVIGGGLLLALANITAAIMPLFNSILIDIFHFCDADSEDDEIFLTDHGRHASFMSLKHDEIMDIMSEGCTDLVIDEKALELFNNDFSYEFSGYLAFSDKENPLMDCMKQFKELGAHDNSWHYIIKIMTAKGEVIDPVELMQFRHYLENNPDMRPLSYTIGVGESESLETGEVNIVMLTHYHERCWPATYEMNWIEYCNTESLDDLKEIEKDLKKEIFSSVKKEYKEDVLADQYKTPFWNVRYSGRSWKETEKVLNYLSDKFPGFKTFTHSFIGYLESSFFEDKFTPLEQMRFSANVLKWAAKKGCEFNLIREGQTVLDMLYECTKKDNYGQERTMVINELIPYLIKMGAKTLEQLRAEDEKDAPDYNREIGKIHRLCRISYP